MTETREKRAGQARHQHPLELDPSVGPGSFGSRSQCVLYHQANCMVGSRSESDEYQHQPECTGTTNPLACEGGWSTAASLMKLLSLSVSQ